MGRTAIDLTGQHFGRLEVLERAGSYGTSHATWRCRCACGNEVVAIAGNLRSGQTKSCGCAVVEANQARRKDAPRRIKHLSVVKTPAKKPHGVVRLITHMGRRQGLQDWARELGMTYQSIQYRLDNGWSVKRALTTPSRKSKVKPP